MTSIEWTDETWNPVTGCTKVSAGCANCYAERVFPRVYGGAVVDAQDPRYPGHRDGDGPRPRRFTDIRIHRDRFDKPLRWRKPRMVFVNSMSDLFHEDVPFDVIDELVGIMESTPQHTFQVLTKRPERMLEWARRPDVLHGPHPIKNIWWGVSAEDQKTFDRRCALLAQMPGQVLFVSLEPLLEEIDCGNAFDGPGESSPYRAINWVIVGGESGPNARPMHPDWVRSIRNQCQQAGVPFFFKQWGEWAPALGVSVGDRNEFIARHKCKGAAFTGGPAVFRCGKNAAGRLLDGREWNEMP